MLIRQSCGLRTGGNLSQTNQPRDDRTACAVVTLGNLFEAEPPPQLVANQSVFLIRPRFTGIGGQELAGALAFFREFKRPDGAVQSADRAGMLIKTITAKDFTSLRMYTVSPVCGPPAMLPVSPCLYLTPNATGCRDRLL